MVGGAHCYQLETAGVSHIKVENVIIMEDGKKIEYLLCLECEERLSEGQFVLDFVEETEHKTVLVAAAM